MFMRGQASFEYMVILAIGLAIIAGFILVSYSYSNSFSFLSGSQQVESTMQEIVSASNTVFLDGNGSSLRFTLYSNGLYRNSYFCGKSIILSSVYGVEEDTSKVKMEGLLPLSAGSFQAYSMLESINSTPTAVIGLDLPISMVNGNFSLSSGSVSYSLKVYNSTGSLTPASMNLSVYSINGSYLGSTYLYTSGVSSGKVSLSSSPSEVIVSVLFPEFNLIYNECAINKSI